MTSQHHEITSFFVDASKALEELPHVKSKLNQTEEELAICRDVSLGKDSRIESLNGDIDALRDQIANLKNERDAAEYSAMEAKDEANRLIASIRDMMKGAAAADAVLNPTPIAPEPSAPMSEAGLSSDSASGSSSALHQSAFGEGSSGPSEHSLGEQQSAEGEQRPLADAPSMDATHPSAYGGDVSTVASVVGNERPYAGEAYWFKPTGTTWADWVAGGGDPAPYVTDADLEAGSIY